MIPDPAVKFYTEQRVIKAIEDTLVDETDLQELVFLPGIDAADQPVLTKIGEPTAEEKEFDGTGSGKKAKSKFVWLIVSVVCVCVPVYKC